MFDALPPDRDARWDLLTNLIAAWYRTPLHDDGYAAAELDAAEARLGTQLPAALREWYGLAGRRTDIHSRQDTLYSPSQLYLDSDVLVFMVENQSVVRWGISAAALGNDDPPVLVESVDKSDVWLRESPTISEFAVSWFLFCLKWSDDVHWVNGGAAPEALAMVERTYRRLPLTELHWPEFPTRFFAAENAVLETNDENWIWLSATSADALREHGSLLVKSGADIQAWSDAWRTATEDAR
jgi:hypothetical protein